MTVITCILVVSNWTLFIFKIIKLHNSRHFKETSKTFKTYKAYFHNELKEVALHLKPESFLFTLMKKILKRCSLIFL